MLLLLQYCDESDEGLPSTQPSTQETDDIVPKGIARLNKVTKIARIAKSNKVAAAAGGDLYGEDEVIDEDAEDSDGTTNLSQSHEPGQDQERKSEERAQAIGDSDSGAGRSCLGVSH